VKQEVIHLGEHQTADEALTAWEREIGELQTIRPKQARKLQRKIDRLQELTIDSYRRCRNQCVGTGECGVSMHTPHDVRTPR
jgi:hypothetical protein